MGYLICDECKSYYELQAGEEPEDFTNICRCGGNLKYDVSIGMVKGTTQTPSNTKKEDDEQLVDDISRDDPFKISILGLITLIIFTGVFIFALNQIDPFLGNNIFLTLIFWISISIILIYQYLVSK